MKIFILLAVIVLNSCAFSRKSTNKQELNLDTGIKKKSQKNQLSFKDSKDTNIENLDNLISYFIQKHDFFSIGDIIIEQKSATSALSNKYKKILSINDVISSFDSLDLSTRKNLVNNFTKTVAKKEKINTPLYLDTNDLNLLTATSEDSNRYIAKKIFEKYKPDVDIHMFGAYYLAKEIKLINSLNRLSENKFLPFMRNDKGEISPLKNASLRNYLRLRLNDVRAQLQNSQNIYIVTKSEFSNSLDAKFKDKKVFPPYINSDDALISLETILSEVYNYDDLIFDRKEKNLSVKARRNSKIYWGYQAQKINFDRVKEKFYIVPNTKIRFDKDGLEK